MTRQEHLTFCKVCTNRKFSSDEGIICGLTNARADFEQNCDNYETSEKLVALEKKLNKNRELVALSVNAGTRFLNLILDGFFFAIVYVFIFVVLGTILGIVGSASTLDPTTSVIIFYAVSFVIYILFYALQEGLSGKTLGKLITGTKVVMENGDKVTFDAALTRTFCRLIPFERFSFLGSDARGWHDTLSKTRVIKDR